MNGQHRHGNLREGPEGGSATGAYPSTEDIAPHPSGQSRTLEAPTALHHCLSVVFRPPFWALPAARRDEVIQEWMGILRGALPAVHAYQTSATGTASDLLVWSAAPMTVPDTPAALLRLHARSLSPMREFLEPATVLWGFARPSPYAGRAGPARGMDAFQGSRARYLVAYPFAKTPDWFLLAPERRRELMGEHIRVGHRHDGIRQLLLYSFGLQDHEWVVMYEMDDLAAFSSLVHDLRSTGARPFTLQDSPVQTGVYLDPGAEAAPWT